MINMSFWLIHFLGFCFIHLVVDSTILMIQFYIRISGSAFDLCSTANVWWNSWMGHNHKAHTQYTSLHFNETSFVARRRIWFIFKARIKYTKKKNERNTERTELWRVRLGAYSYINICILNIFVFFIHNKRRVEIKKKQSKHKFIDIWFD